MTPALIALDWGTSSLRGWLMGHDGSVLASRSESWGIMHLPDGGFPAAFAALTHGWPHGSVAALACGMVGSRQGWVEAPYLPTPAPLAALAGRLARVPTGLAGPDGAGVLHVVPGLVESSPGAPDVMRGEETQAIGALDLLGGRGVLIMPGTHSKWARLADGCLTRFSTLMTGELFALLRNGSILGRDVPQTDAETSGDARDAAFARGVEAASRHGAFARLFQARALVLTGGLEPALVPDYLSGLLIGEEIRLTYPTIAAGPGDASSGGASSGDASSGGAWGPIAITGEARLCARYLQAFRLCGLPAPRPVADTALDGLRLIAAHAGLIPP